MPFTSPGRSIASSFSIFRRSLLQSDDLPLTELIDQNRFQAIFEKHGVHFGRDEDAVYTPAITLWALVSQTFFSDEQRSCMAVISVSIQTSFCCTSWCPAIGLPNCWRRSIRRPRRREADRCDIIQGSSALSRYADPARPRACCVARAARVAP